MPKTPPETMLIKRAFESAYANDMKTLLQCCKDGFDINTVRVIKVSTRADYLCPDVLVEETVASVAIKHVLSSNDNWSFLKDLIEHFGVDNLVTSTVSLQNPSQEFKCAVLEPWSNKWSDLADKNFESSPKHFCLWSICRKDAQLHIPVYCEGKAVGYFMFPSHKVNALNSFFQNCKALEEKQTLGSSVNDIKDQKSVKQKSSLM